MSMSSLSLDLLLEFAKTAALLAVALMAFILAKEPLAALSRPTREAIDAMFYALLTMLSMALPLVLANGIRIDFRVTLIALASLFSGPAAGLAAAAAAVLMRWWLGGPFAAAGIAYTGAAWAIAFGYRLWLGRRERGPRYADIWCIGLSLDACLVGVWLTFLRADLVSGELARVWATILVIVPASAVLLGSVIKWAEERRTLRRGLGESQELLLESQRLGKVGYLLSDPANDRVIWSDSLFESRHVPRRAGFTQDENLQFIHADDRLQFAAELSSAAASRRSFETEFRVLRGDGSIGWERAVAHARPERAGSPASVLCMIQDVTERRQAEAELRARDAELRAIMDNAPIAIFLKDLAGRYLRVNRRLEEWVDWFRGGASGKPAGDLLDDRWREIAKDSDETVATTGAVVEFEASTLSDRADYQHVRITKFPVRDQTGGLVAIGGIIVNDTERKRAETALQEKAAELRAIMDNAPMAIFLKDREGRYRLVNRCYEEWFGWRGEEIYGRTDPELSAPEIARAYQATDREVLDRGRITQIERPATDARSGIEQLLATKFPIRDGEGRVVGIAGFLLDITLRKRAEAALSQSQDLLVESQRLGKVGYILTDAAGQRVSWSDSLFELRRVPRRPFFTYYETIAFIHPEDRPKYVAARDAAFAAGRDFAIDVRVLRGDGSVGWEHSVGHPRFDEAGNFSGLLVVLQDITEAKHADEALRDNQARLQSILDNAPFGVTLKDVELRYVLVNKWFETWYETSASAMIGRRVYDFAPADIADGIEAEDRRVLTTGEVVALEFQPQQRGPGSAIEWVLRTKYPLRDGRRTVVGIVTTLQDVTARRRAEADLLQAQKMETIGRLAGGIAHDFNNLLGAVLGFAGFLLQDLPQGTPQHGFAQRIVKASERGKELVRQILAFSRRSEVDRKPHDLAQIARETQDLLRASLPASTRLDVAASRQPLVAEVNPAQISQILLNLCINANDALLGKPGRIAIELSRVVAGEAEDALQSDAARAREGRVVAGTLQPGQAYARIAVADTGAGMAEDVLRRVFDPFFTTKTPGLGTGLGLAVVHGIVMAYRGALVVTSRPGGGSVFAVYLPLVGERAAPAARAPKRGELRGAERILIVDDDPDSADAMAVGLGRLGYETAVLNDAEEALAVFAEDPALWDVVISDESMPHMQGHTLARRIREIRPSQRLVLCSGYSEATEEMALADSAGAFLLKPISPEQLAEAIRRLIDGR
jgi:PAS domain S-box-containing protein